MQPYKYNPFNHSGIMNKKLAVWGKVKELNELKETTYTPKLLFSIWGGVIPQTGTLQRAQADTILSKTTHKIIVRYASGKDITQDMWIMFKGHRFDIKFILNPYFRNESLELFCEEVIE